MYCIEIMLFIQSLYGSLKLKTDNRKLFKSKEKLLRGRLKRANNVNNYNTRSKQKASTTKNDDVFPDATGIATVESNPNLLPIKRRGRPLKNNKKNVCLRNNPKTNAKLPRKIKIYNKNNKQLIMKGQIKEHQPDKTFIKKMWVKKFFTEKQNRFTGRNKEFHDDSLDENKQAGMGVDTKYLVKQFSGLNMVEDPNCDRKIDDSNLFGKKKWARTFNLDQNQLNKKKEESMDIFQNKSQPNELIESSSDDSNDSCPTLRKIDLDNISINSGYYSDTPPDLIPLKDFESQEPQTSCLDSYMESLSINTPNKAEELVFPQKSKEESKSSNIIETDIQEQSNLYINKENSRVSEALDLSLCMRMNIQQNELPKNMEVYFSDVEDLSPSKEIELSNFNVFFNEKEMSYLSNKLLKANLLKIKDESTGLINPLHLEIDSMIDTYEVFKFPPSKNLFESIKINDSKTFNEDFKKISSFIEFISDVFVNIFQENSLTQEFMVRNLAKIVKALNSNNTFDKEVFIQMLSNTVFKELTGFTTQIKTFLLEIENIYFKSTSDAIKAYQILYVMYINVYRLLKDTKTPKICQEENMYNNPGYIKILIGLDCMFYAFLCCIKNNETYLENAKFVIFQSVVLKNLCLEAGKLPKNISLCTFLTKNIFFSFKEVYLHPFLINYNPSYEFRYSGLDLVESVHLFISKQLNMTENIKNILIQTKEYEKSEVINKYKINTILSIKREIPDEIITLYNSVLHALFTLEHKNIYIFEKLVKTIAKYFDDELKKNKVEEI